MPPGNLFFVEPQRRFSVRKAYAFAQLLLAMEYPDADYVQAWRTNMGFGPTAFSIPTAGWPLPYTVAYHPDGVVMAFSGLRNYGQAFNYLSNSYNTEYYQCPGRVSHILRQTHEAISADLLTKWNAAPNKSRLMITGHSAGGLLAVAAYFQFKNLAGASVPIECYTFGSPMPGTQAVADGVSTRWWRVENVGDPVPALPFWDKLGVPFWSSTFSRQTWRPVGDVVGLKDNGDWSYSSSLFNDPALPRLIMELMRNPTNASGVTHGIRTYYDRLRRTLNLQPGQHEWTPLEADLHEAIVNGVLFSDKVTPTNLRTTAIVAQPPAPTLAEVQSTPTSNGDPAGPPATPPNTGLVGVTHRVFTNATVTSAPKPPNNRFWNGDDKRLIERLLYALQLFTRRDSLLQRPQTSPEISSRLPFIGNDDADLIYDAWLLEEYLGNLLKQQYTTVPE